MSLFERFLELDAMLVAAGFPPTSAWWKKTIRRFYASRKRQLVLRVGRRGGKSSTLCRLAVTELLYGDHVIPPGDLGVVAFISENKPEATNRLRTVEAILTAIGVPFRPAGHGQSGLDVVGTNRGARVYAAGIGAVSGFTGILVICDEVAKWRDLDTGANPATEVIRSVRPTLATQRNGKLILSSSPFSTLDAHHAAVEEGDNVRQMVAIAPSWVANPTLSEAELRQDEPDPVVFDREYGAIPMSSDSASYFDADAVDAAAVLDGDVGPIPGAEVCAGGDTGFVSDCSALVIDQRVVEDEQLLHVVSRVEERRPTPAQALKPSEVVGEWASILLGYGARSMAADGHYRESVREHLDAKGLILIDAKGGIEGKVEAFSIARALLLERRVRLPRNKRLVDQLKAVRAKPTQGGLLTITSPKREGHGDIVSALVLALAEPVGAGSRIPAERRTTTAEDEVSAHWARKKRENEGGQYGGWYGGRR